MGYTLPTIADTQCTHIKSVKMIFVMMTRLKHVLFIYNKKFPKALIFELPLSVIRFIRSKYTQTVDTLSIGVVLMNKCPTAYAISTAVL